MEPFNCPSIPFSECVAKGIATSLEAGEQIQTRINAVVFEADSQVTDVGDAGNLVFSR
jgi:hypothetical protein